jgi:hypothetical protein
VHMAFDTGQQRPGSALRFREPGGGEWSRRPVEAVLGERPSSLSCAEDMHTFPVAPGGVGWVAGPSAVLPTVWSRLHAE